MKQAITLRKREIPAALLSAFPAYKGRTFKLEVSEQVAFYDLSPSGGTWNEYALVSLDGLGHGALPKESPFRPRVEGKTFQLPPRFAVVQRSFFCGKDCGLRFYVHPSDAGALLPEASQKLLG
jgi:hypothetical protein